MAGAPAFRTESPLLVDVAFTPRELAGRDVSAWCVLVVDVLRATTTMVTALQNGCERFVPVASLPEARARAAELGLETLLAGERGGEQIAGFDLGNSPLEYTPARIRGRTVVCTTTNGTAALLAVATAAEVGLAAMVNARAAARWASRRGRDVLVLCAGELGRLSLEDTVCAGLIVAELDRDEGMSLTASDAAVAARAVAATYEDDLGRLRRDATWARRLIEAGHAADVDACLVLAGCPTIPIYAGGAVVLPATVEAVTARGGPA